MDWMNNGLNYQKRWGKWWMDSLNLHGFNQLLQNSNFAGLHISQPQFEQRVYFNDMSNQMIQNMQNLMNAYFDQISTCMTWSALYADFLNQISAMKQVSSA